MKAIVIATASLIAFVSLPYAGTARKAKNCTLPSARRGSNRGDQL